MRWLLLLLAAAQAVGQPPVNIGPVLRDEGAVVAPIHALDITGSATCTVTAGVGSCAVSGGGGGGNAAEVSLTIDQPAQPINLSYWQQLGRNGSFWPFFEAVTWSPERSMFVAVNSTNSQHYHVSFDGLWWAPQPNADGIINDLHVYSDVVWAPALSLFVSVSHGSTGTGPGRVARSADGFTWNVVSDPVPATGLSFTAVAWSPSLALLVAVGDESTGPDNHVYTSTDAINWTARAVPGLWSDVAWSPELGLFVIVSHAGGGSTDIMTSSDGISWSPQSSGTLDPSAGQWQAVAWSPELGLFAALSSTVDPMFGTGDLVTSSDGSTWTLGSIGGGDFGWSDVIWVPEKSMFVGVSDSGGATGFVTTSTNGTGWSIVPTRIHAMSGIAYSPTLNRFVSAGISSPTQGMWSTIDGGFEPVGAAYTVTVTGQSWVTSTSQITCQPFGTTSDGQTVETYAAAALDATVSDRVVGTGFTLRVYSPHGALGTFRFHCTGA